MKRVDRITQAPLAAAMKNLSGEAIAEHAKVNKGRGWSSSDFFFLITKKKKKIIIFIALSD